MISRLLLIYWVISAALVVLLLVLVKITQMYVGKFAPMPEWERPIATVIFGNALLAAISLVAVVIYINKSEN